MSAPRKPSRSPSRPRRALSAPGGKVTSGGEPQLASLVAAALSSGTGKRDEDPRQLTHGFHSYPARFHPLLVRRLLAPLGKNASGARVLDPFVGSGTTLVEAALAGALGLGVDVNPLGVELARLKATVWPAPRRALLVEHAVAIAERSFERARKRVRTSESGERFDDPRHYMPHVFRELVGLREEIGQEPDELLRGALLLVLSSIVVKVSKQPADTAAGEVERAIGRGLPSRLFARKADELGRLMADFPARVPAGTPAPDVRLGDARRLAHIADRSIDVIVTSPPYLGTYDYAEQHTRRFGWLGLDARKFAAAEIGARRRTNDPTKALGLWQADVDAFVAEMARVLKPGALAFIAIGDSAVGQKAIPGDEAVRHAAERAGLALLAWASQDRPNFYRPLAQKSRREHLLALRR